MRTLMTHDCRLSSAKLALLSFTLLISLSATAKCEVVTLVLKTQTSNHGNAGTGDPAYFAVYYLEKPDPAENQAKKTKPKMKRIQAEISNRGRNRDVGQLDTFRLKMDLSIEDIRRVEIGILRGSNAWHLDSFEYYIERDGKQSRPTSIRVGRWLSGDKNDSGKKDPAHQYYYFDVKPPVFPVEKKADSQSHRS